MYMAILSLYLSKYRVSITFEELHTYTHTLEAASIYYSYYTHTYKQLSNYIQMYIFLRVVHRQM